MQETMAAHWLSADCGTIKDVETEQLRKVV
jgi:hypothetical protein